MTGGYKIIDLYRLDIANIQLDSSKIEKIFNDIESTYKTKALLFDNYKINGIEQNATFSSVVVKNSGFEITLGDYKLLIKNNSVEDTTSHLYLHNLEYSAVLENNEVAIGVCALYINYRGDITSDNLKDFIEDGSEVGFVSTGKTPTTNIMSIYHFDTDYILRLDTNENFTITSFNYIRDSIQKIF